MKPTFKKLPLVLWLLLGFLALELGCLSFYAVRVQDNPLPFFRKFYLTNLLFPNHSKTTLETELNIKLYPGVFNDDIFSRSFYVPDALIGFRNARSSATVHHGKFPYITNSQGFTSIGELNFYYPIPKPNNSFRVIILGASVVQGFASYSPKNNLPALIYKSLKKEIPTDKTLEVINAGIGGYDSSQELLYLLTLFRFQPDLLIIYDGARDYLFNNLYLGDLNHDWTPYFSTHHQTNQQTLDATQSIKGLFKLLEKKNSCRTSGWIDKSERGVCPSTYELTNTRALLGTYSIS